MKYTVIVIFALFALVAISPVPGNHQGHSHAADQAESLYTCPMHPTIIKDAPGSCPICGMDLVPQKEETADATASGGSDKAIVIDPVVVQNMGLRLQHIERGSLFHHIRTVGEVEVAEDEISVVNLRYSGWIERIWVEETGQAVRRGEKLFSIYSPQLVAAQKEYLLAVNTGGADSDLARSAATRLGYWNIPPSRLKAIIKAQNVSRTFIIRAPRSGFVLHKNVVQGARVQAGSDLYRIGNLRKIWVRAEVYEFDAPWVRLNTPATMELSFQQGRSWQGSVSRIYPTLNPKTRTLTVRLSFPNPGIELKPGMFATVRIETQRKDDVLLLPKESIIHTGQRQLVFVSIGGGSFEPREVVTGLSGDNHMVEVLSGIEEDEAVVISGQFLLDSESQLREAVEKFLRSRLAKPDHSAGAKDEDDHTGHNHGADETYYTCPMHPTIIQDAPGDCPICGMDLVKKNSGGGP